MSEFVTLTRDHDIEIITINNPPVNALSPGVAESIGLAIEAIQQDTIVKGAVIIGSGRTFIAGADIKEFGNLTSFESEANNLLSLVTMIERCPKPVVAALHGTAFGGGLVVAMASHYRVADRLAQVAMPEVKLGLIPAAAGTQLLPRLAGVAKAVEMCATGSPVKAEDALVDGIIDCVIGGNLLREAVAFLHDVIARSEKPKNTSGRNEKLGDEQTNAPIFAAARDQARRSSPGLIAPLAAIDAVEAATKLPFEEGCRMEAELFRQCLLSDQSKALVHVFLGKRESAKRLRESAMQVHAIIASRISQRYAREARLMVEEGASVAAIHKALTDFGIAAASALKVENLNEHIAARTGIAHRESTLEEILERIICMMINEGAHLLEEDPALRVIDVDLASIHACGFPPWRGGLMWYADTIGLTKVYGCVCRLHAAHDDLGRPSALLKHLAEQNRTFIDYDEERL